MKHALRPALAAIALVRFFLCNTVVAAEPSTRECLAASEQAIALGEQHRLIAARESLLVCASASCPEDVREECTRRVEEVSASIPSVLFVAKDGNGNDISAVKVTMDGKAFAPELNGAALSVDPGAHRFVFETAGQPSVEKTIVLVEGTKDRLETIVFGSTPPPAASDRGAPDGPKGASGTTQRIVGFSAMALGVAGLAVGVVFELERSSTLRERDSICPSGVCPRNDLSASQARVTELTSDANTQGTIGLVGFIAGGALLAGGLAIVITAPSGSQDVAVLPVVTPGFEGVTAHARF